MAFNFASVNYCYINITRNILGVNIIPFLPNQNYLVGIHFKSKYLSTLKSIPKDTTLYSASCHNLEEVEHANRLELDYILISPVLLAKHIHQQTLGWDGFRKLSEKANMPTYALGGICSNDHDYALSLKYGGFGIAGIKKF